jgi:hypothetical protein
MPSWFAKSRGVVDRFECLSIYPDTTLYDMLAKVESLSETKTMPGGNSGVDKAKKKKKINKHHGFFKIKGL